jgi:hypothetical protein
VAAICCQRPKRTSANSGVSEKYCIASKPGARISSGSLVRSAVPRAASSAVSRSPPIVAANHRKW